MRRTIVFIFVVFFAAPALRAQTPSSSSDDAAVRAVVARYVNARDARDPGAVGALFTADADQYTTAGEWRRGRAEVVSGTAESSKQNPGDRRIEIEAVRFITPDVAIADGRYIIDGSSARRWTTIVLERDGGEWRIAAIRNMLPSGAGAPR